MRFRRSEARALPDRFLVAIEADENARSRLASALGARAQIVERERADVVLLDAPSPREALAAVAGGFVQPTILLVDDPHPELAHAALAAGASAILSRQSDAAELIAAIEAVAVGLLVVDANARDVAPARAVGAFAPVEPLTQREREVLAMLARGLSNRRIADRLGIRENTVKAHVAAVLAKLGASTRTGAVTAGIRLGLVFL